MCFAGQVVAPEGRVAPLAEVLDRLLGVPLEVGPEGPFLQAAQVASEGPQVPAAVEVPDDDMSRRSSSDTDSLLVSSSMRHEQALHNLLLKLV